MWVTAGVGAGSRRARAAPRRGSRSAGAFRRGHAGGQPARGRTADGCRGSPERFMACPGLPSGPLKRHHLSTGRRAGAAAEGGDRQERSQPVPGAAPAPGGEGRGGSTQGWAWGYRRSRSPGRKAMPLLPTPPYRDPPQPPQAEQRPPRLHGWHPRGTAPTGDSTHGAGTMLPPLPRCRSRCHGLCLARPSSPSPR